MFLPSESLLLEEKYEDCPACNEVLDNKECACIICYALFHGNCIDKNTDTCFSCIGNEELNSYQHYHHNDYLTQESRNCADRSTPQYTYRHQKSDDGLYLNVSSDRLISNNNYYDTNSWHYYHPQTTTNHLEERQYQNYDDRNQVRYNNSVQGDDGGSYHNVHPEHYSYSANIHYPTQDSENRQFMDSVCFSNLIETEPLHNPCKDHPYYSHHQTIDTRTNSHQEHRISTDQKRPTNTSTGVEKHQPLA
ncbi:unnamed protein product [Mytilus coruscus]|uniref:Phorbol-ester/DAG-type domain-containing protein n=1 Tax=Mytilus coruscus TaxID=42192 RepID=A0A6J8ENL5_MYTCO|nr:unnamed protein product [Mytilus coruscus]